MTAKGTSRPGIDIGVGTPQRSRSIPPTTHDNVSVNDLVHELQTQIDSQPGAVGHSSPAQCKSTSIRRPGKIVLASSVSRDRCNELPKRRSMLPGATD